MRALLIILLVLISVAGCSAPKTGSSEMTPPVKNRTVVIELRVPAEEGVATRPALAARMEPTIVLDATPAQPFQGSAEIDGGVLDVSGVLHQLPDGRYRVQLRYSHKTSTGQRGGQSTIELARDQEFALSGMLADGGEEAFVVVLH